METRILIVDDDPFICRQLEELYASQRYTVASAPNSTEALRLLGEQEFALAVVDLKIPGTDGIGLTREIRDRWPDLDVIMITGYASIKGAVEAIKQGASDYITKPFQKEEILLATEKILEKRRLLDEINYLRSQLSDRYSFANMVSRNRVMHEIFETISVLAQNDATVLIYGESGTGKELAARAIHFQGKRKGGRFVAINCAAFPDTLLESELFGYERGAFTGRGARPRRQDRAVERRHPVPRRDREHLAQHAAEAAARPRGARGREARRQPAHQGEHAHHLRHQHGPRRSWCPRGACARTSTTASTSCRMRIPPLRERIEDIPLLVGEFLRNSEMAREKGINRLSNKALSQLMSYGWPGNVRELGNVIERAILRTSGSVIREVDLPGHSSVGRENTNGNGRQPGYDYEVPLKEYLRRAEKDYLGRVLRKYRGGINLSAKHALVDAATLHRKMKLHGLRREEYRFRSRLDGDAVGSG